VLFIHFLWYLCISLFKLILDSLVKPFDSIIIDPYILELSVNEVNSFILTDNSIICSVSLFLEYCVHEIIMSKDNNIFIKTCWFYFLLGDWTVLSFFVIAFIFLCFNHIFMFNQIELSSILSFFENLLSFQLLIIYLFPCLLKLYILILFQGLLPLIFSI